MNSGKRHVNSFLQQVITKGSTWTELRCFISVFKKPSFLLLLRKQPGYPGLGQWLEEEEAASGISCLQWSFPTGAASLFAVLFPEEEQSSTSSSEKTCSVLPLQLRGPISALSRRVAWWVALSNRSRRYRGGQNGFGIPQLRPVPCRWLCSTASIKCFRESYLAFPASWKDK